MQSCQRLKSLGLYAMLLAITAIMLGGCQAPIDPNAPGFYLMQPNGKPAKNMKFRAICEDGRVIEGVTDRAGDTGLTRMKNKESCGTAKVQILGKAK